MKIFINASRLLFSVIAFSVSVFALGQSWPSFTPPFTQTEVSTIYITMPEDSLQQMIDGQSDEHEYIAQFGFQSSQLNDTLENVSIRLRGNTSLNAAKKSFAISFNHEAGVGQWQEIEQMNLIGQQNDPSLLRSKLCHDMHRYMGVASARTSFVALYINDEYRGLYLNQEHIDEEFAKKYFDAQGDGNLYKCSYPADLDYIGSDPDEYKLAPWGTRTYDLKTNEWRDDYADLAAFISVLNNASLANLPCQLPQIFDVDAFLRAAAVDVLSGNWDGYIYNKNNFYLYQHQLTGQFIYIPYDMDNTLGIDWVGQDWTERNLYNWSPSSEERPLFKRLMQVDEYRDRFSYYVQFLMDIYFTESNVVQLAEQWLALIADYVENDTYYPLDYDYSYADFSSAITDDIDFEIYPHTDFSIADYVQARSEYALDQLENFQLPGTIVHWLYHDVSPESAIGEVTIHAYITNGENCQLMTSGNGVSYTEQTTFNDEGIDGDELAGDNLYTYHSTTLAGDKVYYKLISEEGNAYPCTFKLAWHTSAPAGLYINEVMAENDNSITDENGEHEDWLELWNGTTASINLDGKYLTDELQDWNKFPLPAVNLPAGQFLLVWLDNEPEQAALHATFRLGSNDNNIWLITMQDGSPRHQDAFWPCISQADFSQERITDGSNTIMTTNAPTPGLTNSFVDVAELSYNQILAYPNPAHDKIYFNIQLESVELIDSTGRIVIQDSKCMRLATDRIERGVYFLRMNHIIVQAVVVN
ncbi:MAG: CotH kinase family protein [Flavobacteriales bacterium]